MFNSKNTLSSFRSQLSFGKLALFCASILLPVLAYAEAIPYTQQVKNNNLVWYMGLNDASGSTTVSNEGKLNTNQGTATNVTFQQSGVIGTSASFNGNDSGITLSETSHVWTNNQATLEAWVKASDVSKLVNIFGYRTKNNFGNFARTLNTDSSGKVVYYDFNGNEMKVTATSATLPTDEWVYVAGIINGNAARLFINGQQVAPASTNQGKSLWNSGDWWVIGNKDLKSNSGTLTTFNGTMDELATYNVTQSQSDFLSKYQVATNQVMEKSLMANATVTASSTYNTTTFNVSKIKDGILNDIEGTGSNSFDFGKGYWIAVDGVTNASITVDLGQSYNIDKIDLQNCRNAAHGDSGTKDFTLYYSNDGTNWTKILNSTLTTAKEATIMPIESFTFDVVNARYVKFEANSYISGGRRAGLTEMWIFESTDYWGLGTDLSKDWTIDGTKKTGAKFTEANSNTGTVLATHTGSVTLNSDAEFEITGSRILTQSGNITGTGSLTKTGDGTLKLTGNNDYTGATNVTAGKLIFANGSTSTGSSELNITRNASVEIYGTVTVDSLNANNNEWIGYLEIRDGANLTVTKSFYTNNGVAWPCGKVTQTGGSVSLLGTAEIGTKYTDDNFFSAYNISAGTLSIPNETLKVGMVGPGKFEISGTAEASVKAIDLASGEKFGQVNISGGKLILAGDITHTGTGNATVNLGGGTVNTTADSTWADSISVVTANSTTLEVKDGTTTTINSTVSGNGSLDKTGTGTLVLTATNNTYSGNTTISNGTLKLTENGTLGTGTITNNATLEFAHDTDQTFNNTITGTGTILKSGVGTLWLKGTAENPITAAMFKVDAGTLRFSDETDSLLYVDSDMTFDSGSTLHFDQDADGMDQLVLTADHALTMDSDSLIDITMGSAQSGASYPIITNGKDFEGSQLESSYWNSLLTPSSDYYWNLSVVGGNQVWASIDSNAVPEPSTWALLILGMAGLMWLKRSEKREARSEKR